MLEKDMEELIARYPSEFFPLYHFTLAGRQQTFPGVGRYDLLFHDSRGMKILMELKARPANYPDAEQLAKYNDALKLGGHKGIVLWLVATNIQHSVREFLDTLGIQYSEIHVAEYYRVAEKYDYQVTYEKTPEIKPLRPLRTREAAAGDSASDGHTRSVVRPKFAERLATLEEGFEAAYRTVQRTSSAVS
jgi:hypothetical protein